MSTINKYLNSEEILTGAKRFPARSEVEPGGEKGDRLPAPVEILWSRQAKVTIINNSNSTNANK